MNNLKKLLTKTFPRLAKYININRGLIPDIQDDRDYVMGVEEKYNWQIVRPDGDWRLDSENIVREEQQDFDCTGHGISNILDLLFFAKFGIKTNTSEAYINGMSGTTRNSGNSLRTVLEAVRTYGWVEEEVWPQSKRWQKIPQAVIELGQEKLKEWDFGYDLVAMSFAAFAEASKYSPLYTGGYAWWYKDGMYYTAGAANHCFVGIEMKTPYAFDSYNPFIKRLAPDYQFYQPRRIYLGKKNPDFKKEELNKLITAGKKYLIRPNSNGEFYKITPDKLIYVEDIRQIADEIAEGLKESPYNINEMLKFLTQTKKIQWQTEKAYFDLLK